MVISFRPATLSDISQMCDLLADLFSVESDFSPDRDRQARGLTLLINDTSGSSAVFVAEEAEEVSGMCSVQTLISTAEGGRVGLVEDLVVRRGYRGNGIGKGLLREIETWCAVKEITRIQLLRDRDNMHALGFYRSIGWSETGLHCMRKFL